MREGIYLWLVTPFDYNVPKRNNVFTLHKAHICKIKENIRYYFQVLLELTQLSSIYQSLKLTGMLYFKCSKLMHYPFLLPRKLRKLSINLNIQQRHVIILAFHRSVLKSVSSFHISTIPENYALSMLYESLPLHV